MTETEMETETETEMETELMRIVREAADRFDTRPPHRASDATRAEIAEKSPPSAREAL